MRSCAVLRPARSWSGRWCPLREEGSARLGAEGHAGGGAQASAVASTGDRSVPQNRSAGGVVGGAPPVGTHTPPRPRLIVIRPNAASSGAVSIVYDGPLMATLSIRESVGAGGKNNRDDVAAVLDLLRIRRSEDWYHGQLGDLALPDPRDAKLAEKLVSSIKVLQAKVQGAKAPDGLVTASGNTILFLGGVRLAGRQIIVDLGEQVLYAYEGPLRVFEFDCTSGDSSHATTDRPALFEITRKEKIYRSKKYDAQMNYAMFFSADGKAIHQSNAVSITSVLKSLGVNYFGSHGCVRLAEDDARVLFNWAAPKTPVFIDLSRKAFA